MLDLQFIRDNQDLVERSAQAKGYKVDIAQALQLDDERRKLIAQADELRRQRNQLAAEHKDQKPGPKEVEAGRTLKEKVAKIDHQLAAAQEELDQLLQAIPNVIPEDTPLDGEDASQTIKEWGEPRSDKVKDHLTWGEERSLIDFERGAKVAGTKFYFLAGDLVRLELAVFQYGLSLATAHGFTPMTVPHMVNDRIARGSGFLPRGEERQIYKIEGQDLNLIATAEIPLTGYHADEI